MSLVSRALTMFLVGWVAQFIKGSQMLIYSGSRGWGTSAGHTAPASPAGSLTQEEKSCLYPHANHMPGASLIPQQVYSSFLLFTVLLLTSFPPFEIYF